MTELEIKVRKKTKAKKEATLEPQREEQEEAKTEHKKWLSTSKEKFELKRQVKFPKS
jgi:hypothetical protein